MEFLSEYGLFLAKSVTVVAAILVVLAAAAALSAKARQSHKEHIKIKNLGRKYESMSMALQAALLPKKKFKEIAKARKKEHKLETKGGTPHRRRVFVLDFHGDIRASQVGSLREEITAVLTVAMEGDEVVLRLESGGGLVHAYGLAASQLARLKGKGVKLIVAVDKVAASGGYMMACVADHLIAAPFAILGSIGVVAQLPNFHRFLKKNDIDFEQFTAGEYKRTVTVFGENNDKARTKFQADIEDIHQLFKDFVAQHRAQLDLDRVATGEYWYGLRALDLHLADELRTSDDYLLEASREADLFEIKLAGRKPLMERMFAGAARLWEQHRGEDLPAARL